MGRCLVVSPHFLMWWSGQHVSREVVGEMGMLRSGFFGIGWFDGATTDFSLTGALFFSVQ